VSGESRYGALRRDLLACFGAAIEAVEPEGLVADFLGKQSAFATDRVRIAGFGKAAVAMARGARGVLGERFAGGVLIVPRGQAAQAGDGFEVFEGGHPIPNQEGVEGARAIERLAKGASSIDLVLVLISGGGSALMTLPPEGVPLVDIQATTRALLEAGADIGELNAVRKHLDRLKGGQLARAAAPARVLALVLSDVVGDPLDVIASGPVSPDPSTFDQAMEILKSRGVWSQASVAVRRHLEMGAEGAIAETPKAGDECFRQCATHIVGNNKIAAEAACAEAKRRGYAVELASTTVTGEARRVGAALARTALEIASGKHALAPPACVISAGETTVTVTGSGKGGRNQEVALGAAIELDAARQRALRAGDNQSAILVASLGTDGIDGPTDAAGAIATGETLERARTRGLDALATLADNDSYPFFETLEDLVTTGPTGTNVMDLHVVLVDAGASRGC
jgi:hydroxypyruvate reductase